MSTQESLPTQPQESNKFNPFAYPTGLARKEIIIVQTDSIEAKIDAEIIRAETAGVDIGRLALIDQNDLVA